ncbi:MAG: flagellar hook protein FlgE [Armatimonadetes bacterium]|nr:flagellar hook protein FlgE [Armatimonadota bacterium]
MLQALLAGVASIKAHQTRMDAIGNDLANVDTTAYKSSSVSFAEMIAQTVTGASAPNGSIGGRNPVQIGLGVIVSATNTNEAQGSLNATNNPTDLAVQGNGLFMVSDGSGIDYSRDGSFTLDANGDMVQTSTGRKLVGWRADSLGKVDTTQSIDPSKTVNIPIGTLNAVQGTTNVTLTGNLSSAALATDSWSTTTRVYDSLGNPSDLTVTFKNHSTTMGPGAPAGAVSSWDWDATVGGSSVGSSSSTGNQPIYFDAAGNIVNGTALGAISVPGQNGAVNQAENLDFSAIHQLATATQVSVQNQNGFGPGSLESFQIGNDGLITGVFTNGLTRPLGQVALATFPNPAGLQRVGSNLWTTTVNSGTPNVGAPQLNGRGSIQSGFLEQSNVDISTAFTDLIVTQRGFQANTKIVQTVDEMLQDLINLKR